MGELKENQPEWNSKPLANLGGFINIRILKLYNVSYDVEYDLSVQV